MVARGEAPEESVWLGLEEATMSQMECQLVMIRWTGQTASSCRFLVAVQLGVL